MRRRGFTVLAPGEDFPEDAGDRELLDMAVETCCVVVSTDRYFMGEPLAVYVPHRWLERYNSWELVTKIVGAAAVEARRVRCVV